MIEKRWQVSLSTKMEKIVEGKQKKKELPHYVVGALKTLMIDIEHYGPTLGFKSREWPHFGPLGNGVYHCHLLKSKAKENPSPKKEKGPCYVACWRVEDKKVKIVEVYYVGSHENAPY
jgi:hypothetical protein